MSKNGNCFELCVCKFYFRLYVLKYVVLMSPHGDFQKMKQSSKYLFPDLVNSPFMLLPNFLPIISYRFSSKDVWVSVEYVGAILILIAVSRVWIYLML